MVLRAFDISQRPTSPVLAHEVALQLAIRSLRCLCSIARGVQVPQDLDSEDESAQTGVSQRLAISQDLERIHTDIIVSTFHWLRKQLITASEYDDSPPYNNKTLKVSCWCMN